MTSLRFLLIFIALVVGIHCLTCDFDCDHCPQANGAACWYNDWQRRDRRCGSEIGKADDSRFSFKHHWGGRCYCCPPPPKKRRTDKYKNYSWTHRRAMCANDCDACEPAVQASACWTDWRKRDERCGSEIGKANDARFSFLRLTGGRCYCCP